MKFQSTALPKAIMIILGLVFAIGTTGCNKKGCMDPLSENYDPDATKDDGSCEYTNGTFKLNVTHMVGNQPFSTSTVYTANDGRQFKFTSARFYISEMAAHAGTEHEHLEEYGQIIAGTSSYDLGAIPAGSYDEFEFNIGVDSAANHSDPTTYATGHALAATSATFDHWNWNSGYVFVKIEGLADTTLAMNGAVDGPFQMHVGGDSFLRVLSFPKDMSIVSGEDYTLNLKIDWLGVVGDVDFRLNGSTHTMDNMTLANEVITKLLSSISLN